MKLELHLERRPRHVKTDPLGRLEDCQEALGRYIRKACQCSTPRIVGHDLACPVYDLGIVYVVMEQAIGEMKK
jgi:hypothetical protein